MTGTQGSSASVASTAQGIHGEKFGTVVVAMVTPFDDTGALDCDAAARLAVHLTTHGCDGLVLSGTTGESPTTSLDEKLAVLRVVRESVGDSIKLTVGVGTYNTATSIEAAVAAEKAGADGLLVVTPYYSKPPQAGLIQHFTAVADATDLPVCLYDIPSRSGVPLASDTLRRLSEHPRIVAVKDAKGNFAEATPLIRETGLEWYSGDDPLNLPWLVLGASGFISVIGHAAPQALRELYTSFEEGNLDRARSINAMLAPLVAAQGRLGGVTMAKAALGLQGMNVGAPRLPQVPATEQQIAELRKDMKKAGVL